jgi:2-amino-4-hydroxy-6-hydroxymethyldihydropteridine diphosphokinase
MPHYFVSLGSNIEPYQNVARAIDALLQLSPRLDVSRIIKTKAAGFQSSQYFLNLCVRFFSPLSSVELKSQLEKIEEALGRDRTDPNRKLKDRPADLDILFALEANDQTVASQLLPKEPYIRPTVIDLLQYLGIDYSTTLHIPYEIMSLPYKNHLIGLQAITIYLQDNKTVVNQQKLVHAN